MEVEKRISVKEFMRIFGLTYYTAYNIVRIVDFPSVKLGRKYYVDVARAVVRADEKGIALLKEKVKEVIGVKKINQKELDAIRVLGLQIYEI